MDKIFKLIYGLYEFSINSEEIDINFFKKIFKIDDTYQLSIKPKIDGLDYNISKMCDEDSALSIDCFKRSNQSLFFIHYANFSLSFTAYLSVELIDNKYCIFSKARDKAHGYRKIINKEIDFSKISKKDAEILDILTNGRNQIFVSDFILNMIN